VRARILAIIAALIVAARSAAATTILDDNQPPQDFLAYLLNRDVVFIGTVATSDLALSRGTTVTLRPDQVLLGTLPQDLRQAVIITTVRSNDPHLGLTNGTRVLAWGGISRISHFFVGSLARIHADGSFAFAEAFTLPSDPPAVHLSQQGAYQRLVGLIALQRSRHPLESFAVARAGALISLGPQVDGNIWRIESVRSLIGSNAGHPSLVRFTSMGYCTYIPARGDTLFLPITTQGDTLVIPFCPSSLKLHRGRIGILGLQPISAIPQWLEVEGGHLSLLRH
jgi:hypothetical protein